MLLGIEVGSIMQMYYQDRECIQARGFNTTYKIYDELLGMDCSRLCERFNPQHASSFPTPKGSYFCPCDFCEVCGINGDEVGMVMCESCNEQGRQVQACYTCLPHKQLQWLLDDPHSTHHWCCSFCRYGNILNHSSMLQMYNVPHS